MRARLAYAVGMLCLQSCLCIDFSPEHIAHARALAAELKLTNIIFDEGDFATLGADWPANYGTFDYVTLHGIYSWVPEAIRRSLIAILSAATWLTQLASGPAATASLSPGPRTSPMRPG